MAQYFLLKLLLACFELAYGLINLLLGCILKLQISHSVADLLHRFTQRLQLLKLLVVIE